MIQLPYQYIILEPFDDPYFDWKRPCFEGLTFKNRGQLGSRIPYDGTPKTMRSHTKKSFGRVFGGEKPQPVLGRFQVCNFRVLPRSYRGDIVYVYICYICIYIYIYLYPRCQASSFPSKYMVRGHFILVHKKCIKKQRVFSQKMGTSPLMRFLGNHDSWNSHHLPQPLLSLNF